MTLKPRAWLCELAQEDGTTMTQFVEQDPAGLRWNDAGEPSPYRTTPLLTLEQAEAMVAAERERLINDAAEWGDALNSAAWALTEAYRKHTGKVDPPVFFNHSKAILRDGIAAYFAALKA